MAQRGLTFNQFIINLGPPVIIIFVVILAFIWAVNRDQFKPIIKLFTVNLLLEKIRYDFLNTRIDHPLMKKGIFFLSIAILLFITQTITGLAPGVIAVSIGIFLVLASKIDIEMILEEVEWTTLMFFVGLFIMVGALEEYCVIEWIAHHVFMNLGDNPFVTVLAVEWVAGIASGFLDNIPFTITMIPVIEIMNEANPMYQDLLWWSLALGACLGGNITIVGASANIVSVGIAKNTALKYPSWNL